MITSTANPSIKYVEKLCSKSAFRKCEDFFVVEGLREYEMARTYYVPEKIFVCPDIFPMHDAKHFFSGLTRDKIIEVSKKVYAKISYREGSEGMVSLFKKSPTILEDIDIKPNLTLLVLDGLEKPGNIGALLRTSDAAGVDAVIIVNPKVDLYNPNLIRSSLGAFFTNKVILSTVDEVTAFCQENEIQIFTADLSATEICYDQNFRKSVAFILGSESDGVDQTWYRSSGIKKIRIPMKGKVDSMNVSVSGAILLYEVFRQELGKT